MLAIEKDEDTDKIVKMGYIAWPEDENPVDLEISRIHLTDGEMVVPIPPPPPQDEDRQQAMQLLEELQRQEELRRQLQERRQQQANPEIAKENKERGDAFLAENADRDEVNVTESGLQYQVIETGKGEKPAVTDTVVVHYIGRLLDGTVFDSSRDRGDPTTFPLHQLIPGWTEGLQLMSPGAKYRFWMPSHLAYGQHAPPPIGPNQVLDFEVELIEVVETGLYLKP
ncbi:MAG: FKBP-type peptidyl-prolyl cis-trans isomerase [Verrucomicrobia bacterium]|nr:FKBP-type peptidyl-prolyl cis-trans isomerase [Verrucomicrobiota bacterium]